MYRTLIILGAIVSIGISVLEFDRSLVASLDHRYQDAIYHCAAFGAWWFLLAIGMIRMVFDHE